MKKLKNLFKQNRLWAESVIENNPNFFQDLSQQQNPQYLWIGCSDSRVPANQIIDLPPGEVFVHRNIANLVIHTDLNCLSVIQYAVEILKIKHIIVCGHYGCGGIQAAMNNQELGLIDNWLKHIKEIKFEHVTELRNADESFNLDKLCEFNVIEQVKNVCHTTIVQKAWKNGADLSVHGWIYDIHNGILKDLDTCISSIEEL